MLKRVGRRSLCALLMLLMLSGMLVPASAAKVKGAVKAVQYTMDVKLDAKQDQLTEKVTIKVKNDTNQEVKTLVFRNIASSILDYDRAEYPEKVNLQKSSKIKSVKTGSKKLKVSYEKDKSVFSVNLGKKALKPGKTMNVTIQAVTDVPLRDDRFGYRKTKDGKLYHLGFCYPYLAPNQDGKWNKDPYFDDGESRASGVSNFKVTFTAPKDYVVASVGTHSTKKGVTTIDAKKVRDFALVACNFMKKESFQASGVTVNNYYLKGKYSGRYRKISRLVATDAIALYTEAVGKYPYKQLDMAPAIFGMGYGGMEFCGMVMNNATAYYGEGTITAKTDPISLMEVVSHEIGHQWFYAAVGNDEYNEGWLDEGFTSYLEKIVYGQADTESVRYANTYADPVIDLEKSRKEDQEMLEEAHASTEKSYVNIPVSAYGPDDSYSEREYEYGCMFLRELRYVMGDKKFGAFLKDYYKRYKLKMATTADVLAAVRRQDKSAAVEKVIGKYVSKKYL